MTGGTRQVEGRDSKPGSSSTSRPSPSRQTTKRRKLEHPLGDVSGYFSKEIPVRRGPLAIPSTPTSSHPSSTTATATASTDAIIIDAEDDAPATNDDFHEPIMLRTLFPDPMDVIGLNYSNGFGQNNPSPVYTLTSSLEEKRKSPQDRESTLGVRNAMKKAIEPVSRPDSDGDDIRRRLKILPGLLSRNRSTAQAEASSGRGNVEEKMALFKRDILSDPTYPGVTAGNTRLRKVIERLLVSREYSTWAPSSLTSLLQRLPHSFCIIQRRKLVSWFIHLSSYPGTGSQIFSRSISCSPPECR